VVVLGSISTKLLLAMMMKLMSNSLPYRWWNGSSEPGLDSCMFLSSKSMTWMASVVNKKGLAGRQIAGLLRKWHKK